MIALVSSLLISSKDTRILCVLVRKPSMMARVMPL